MLSFINIFNFIILLLFTGLYFYQGYYVIVALFKKEKVMVAMKNHKFAVVIAARNESTVIGQLINSIKQQKYPTELVDIYVVADNCTDNTADVAREAGAIVFERFNRQNVGKGYALDFAFKLIINRNEKYEGYFVFDADNLLDENYIAEMNKVFDNGYKIITSYRNSKNYDTNWLSAGYSLWFLREAKYLNNARMMLNTSCAISGTGFMVSDDVIRKNNGWKHHLLTEDIEFSIDNAIQGEKIGYCGNAVLYDEQPYIFEQSWNQRLRWAKGFYQVFAKYGKILTKSIFTKKSFSCYDMLMTIMPALFLTLISVTLNLAFLTVGLINIETYPEIIRETSGAVIMTFANSYAILFALGLITTITEWKQINASTKNKIKYMFSFPLFIFTYIPISIVALFKKIEWKPITHSIVKSIEEVRQ
ncbi:MAG: glycosyltransferase family 2 protein [Sedimentibacter sp.]|uniref:glycosyltransferase family 2 protein n=1 Tax=Sedimentibacter sp. TaxID=1960295 RepID=UPI002980DDB4|nr:glycosyltransferase family 2 protein [Sedimentibacter sp.]MDW5298809.1 glycosyltransferase family 2 protein [Sedimentibacter sp.]